MQGRQPLLVGTNAVFRHCSGGGMTGRKSLAHERNFWLYWDPQLKQQSKHIKHHGPPVACSACTPAPLPPAAAPACTAARRTPCSRRHSAARSSCTPCCCWPRYKPSLWVARTAPRTAGTDRASRMGRSIKGQAAAFVCFQDPAGAWLAPAVISIGHAGSCRLHAKGDRGAGSTCSERVSHSLPAAQVRHFWARAVCAA